MKFFIRNFAALLLLTFLFQSCLKDKCTQTFKVYRPVLKTKQEVRNNIKTKAPQPLQQPGKLTLFGNYIYLNEPEKGIHIIDNANPSQPRNTGFIEIPGNVDIAIRGNILYADLYDELVSIDISNPLNVQLKNTVLRAFPERFFTNGFTSDTSVFIVGWTAKDTTVNLNCTGGRAEAQFDDIALRNTGAFSNIAAAGAPVVTGINGSMARFTLLNDFMYTVSNTQLQVFSLLNAEQPQRVNTVNLGWGIETIYPFRNNLFIGSQTGMFIYGTQNPALPNALGAFTHAFACDPVVADDMYAYVTLRNGTTCRNTAVNQLDVIDVQNLQRPFLIKSYPLTNPKGLSKDGNILFVCDGRDGVRVFDATWPYSLKQTFHFKGIETYDVIAWNGNAIVVSKEALIQYNYTNPAAITERSRLTIQK
ncbi:MAG: hypothetical protein K2X48_16165 [Chitinophagaceae bacterium]|nr:hypothetical protein [Chitinophagaceae bacterium]